MPNVTLHFYAANDLNGDVLLELTDDDDFLKSVELKVALSELGGGSFRLARKVGFPLFPTGAVQPDVLCRVLVHAYSDTEYFWGFFINKRAQVLVGKEGSEEFQFGGPGPKQYLERGGLGVEQFTGAGSWHIDLDNGVFRWNEDATAGRVLNKVIGEDAANPASGCPDLTKSFTAANDSDGNPWVNDVTTAGADDFELPIGNSILKTLWELEDIEDIEAKVFLGTVATPVFRLDALPQLGTDYSASGTGYGADILRFLEASTADYPAGNIGSLGGGHKLTVEGQSERKVSHVNIKGKDGSWATAVRGTWSPGDYVKWATIAYPRSSAEGILERAGTRWLRAQEQMAEEVTVPMIPGDDDTEGRYFPVPDDSRVLWVGNTASVHTGPATGASPLDYRNEPLRVTRINLELVEASDDTDSLTRALSWQVEVSFNTVRGGSDSTRQRTTGGRTPGPCCITLCLPSEAGGEIVTGRLYYTSQDDVSSGLDDADYSASWGAQADIVSGPNRLRASPQNTQSYPGGIADYDDAGLPANTIVSGLFSMLLSESADVLSAVQNGGVVRTVIRSSNRHGVGVNGAAQQNFPEWCIRVYRPGTGFIGTVLDVGDGTATVRFDPSSALPSIPMEGVAVAVPSAVGTDYLVVDLGADHQAPITGGTGWSYSIADSYADDLPYVVDSVANQNSWLEFTSAGTVSGPGDGNANLIGNGPRAKRCDDTEHYGLDAREPTVLDDEDQGFRIGTLWLDETTGRVWWLTDNTAGAAVWILIADPTPPGPEALANLSDVTITAPALDDDLRYDGAEWINDPRKWEAVTNGEDVFVWEGDDLVHEWNESP